MNVRAQGIDFIRQAEVVGRLRARLPAESVLHQTEDTRPYECDGLAAYRELPMVVALPADEAEVTVVLETCHALGVPVVARGAGTGLSGGALPRADGVLLSLAQAEAHPRRRPGRRASRACSRACATSRSPRRRRRYGLYYAPDPSSQIACTIGGNVAENSGGVHCLKYGLTVHNVLRVRGVHDRGRAARVRQRKRSTRPATTCWRW